MLLLKPVSQSVNQSEYAVFMLIRNSVWADVVVANMDI